MIVKFAAICDCCGERSPEYTRWPICRECGNDCCGECASHLQDEDEHGWSCYCRVCMIQAAEERHWDHKIHARIEGDT